MSQSAKVFVIIPFTDDFDAIYERSIKPICEDAGYEINKADSTDTQQNILRDVIHGIHSADLLIADLTDSNPNVFYEAGVADGLGIPNILITQDIESVPFDLDSYNMIEYTDNAAGIQSLEESLRPIVEKHSQGEMEFGSPVTDFTDVEMKISSKIGEHSEAEPRSASSPVVDDDKGLMDYAVDAEAAQSDLQNSVMRIVERTEDLEQKIVEQTNRITAIKESGGEISASRGRRLFREPAKNMQEYGESISDDTESIRENIDVMMTAEQAYIEFADPNDDREELIDHQQDLRDFQSMVDEVIGNLEDFHYEATQLKGLNRTLNRGVNELTTPLSDLINTLAKADTRAERMDQLIEQKLTQ